MNEEEYYIQMLQQMMYQQQLLGPYGYDMATQFLPQDPDNLGDTNWTQDRIQMAGDPILGELTNSGNPALFEPEREYVETPGWAIQERWRLAPPDSARAYVYDRIQSGVDPASAVEEIRDLMDRPEEEGGPKTFKGLPAVYSDQPGGGELTDDALRDLQLQALFYEAKDMEEAVAKDPHIDGRVDGRGYVESPSAMMKYFDERNLPYPTERYPMPLGDGPLPENAAEYQGLLNRNDDGSLNKLKFEGFDAQWDAAASEGAPRSGDRDAQKRYAMARTMLGKNSDPLRHAEERTQAAVGSIMPGGSYGQAAGGVGSLNKEARQAFNKTEGGRRVEDQLRKNFNARTQTRLFDDYKKNRAVYSPTDPAKQRQQMDAMKVINGQIRKASSSTQFQDAMRRRLAQQSAMGF